MVGNMSIAGSAIRQHIGLCPPGCQNVPTYEIQICEQGRCFTWEGNSELIKRYFSFPFSFLFAEYLSLFGQDHVSTSGETLCHDNCQLIGMPYFHTRSAGKNNCN